MERHSNSNLNTLHQGHELHSRAFQELDTSMYKSSTHYEPNEIFHEHHAFPIAQMTHIATVGLGVSEFV